MIALAFQFSCFEYMISVGLSAYKCVYAGICIRYVNFIWLSVAVLMI